MREKALGPIFHMGGSVGTLDTVRTESPPRAHQPRLDWDKLGEDLPDLGALSLSLDPTTCFRSDLTHRPRFGVQTGGGFALKAD